MISVVTRKDKDRSRNENTVEGLVLSKLSMIGQNCQKGQQTSKSDEDYLLVDAVSYDYIDN